MKKILIYVSLALWIVALTSCTEDPSRLSLENEENGALMEIFERYETEYGLAFKNDFSKTDFAPVGLGYALPYTPARDANAVTQLLQYLENNVLSCFPKEFINEYMPRTILLVDSLIVTYEYSDTYNEPNVEWSERRPIAGYVTDRYLALGNVGPRFDPDAEGLKEEMISLIVERLLCNGDRLPSLTDFQNETEAALRACGVEWYIISGTLQIFMPSNYPYWNGLQSASFKTWYVNEQDYTRWLACGLLKPGRRGYVEFYDESVMGNRQRHYLYDKGTIAKDFGDFTALVLTKTQTEIETFCDAVEANDALPLADSDTVDKHPEWIVERGGQKYDRRFPLYGGPAGATSIRNKVEIVKAWWRQAGITLREPQ